MELIHVLLAAAVVIVVSLLLTRLLSARRGATPGKARGTRERRERGAEGAGAAALPREVTSLLAQNRKVEAIRLLREKTGASLVAAKEAVETVGERGRSATTRDPGLVVTLRKAEQLGAEVRQLVAEGRKVEAIRLIRLRTGMDLREARELVDRLS